MIVSTKGSKIDGLGSRPVDWEALKTLIFLTDSGDFDELGAYMDEKKKMKR